MLAEFKVINFKGFKNEINIKFDDSGKYKFNEEAIKNNISKTSILYGRNGSGKSNIALAIFDIVGNLTSNRLELENYKNYINLNNKETKNAKFYYKFIFNNDVVEYHVEKSNYNEFIFEKLTLNDELMTSFNYNSKIGETRIEGTQNLNTGLNKNSMSFLKYVINNSVIDDGNPIKKTMKFVENMLLFYSLQKRGYQGYTNNNDNISLLSKIAKEGKTKDFQIFLNENHIDLKLTEKVNEKGDLEIFVDYNNKIVNFYSVASNGTNSLVLFYYWYLEMSKMSLVIIDEFDAYYHHELAASVVELLKNLPNTQVLLTTHNTDLMNNELLRPDCYFILNKDNCISLKNATDKELRLAHNLAKMYKSGAFNE